MPPDLATYPGHRFPAEIISDAVWLYHVFALSLRDVELILAERGIGVTHESIRRWCTGFGSELAARLRRRRPRPGDTWHLDEVFLHINGVLHYLWRAVDQPGVVPDTPAPDRRSAPAGCSCPSTACSTTAGGRWTSTASCSTSWCRTGGTPRPRSAFSSTCSPGC